MSEHLTHIAIFEDTYRLLQHDRRFIDDFKTSLRNHPDVGLMCSASRGNHLFAIPYLEDVKGRWQARGQEELVEEKIAAAIGWLSHRAIDLQVKPNYLKIDEISDPRFSETENEIYHDAVIFDKVYEGGRVQSLSPYVFLSDAVLQKDMAGHVAATLLHINESEPLFCALTQAGLLGLRRFNQESESPEAWLEALPQHYQKLGEDLETYADAYQRPDPVKMEKYIYGPNVYDEDDEIIRLARGLRSGDIPDISLQTALEKAESQSHYAQGLRRSLQFMMAAQEFYLDQIDKSTAYDRVEIFYEPHRI